MSAKNPTAGAIIRTPRFLGLWVLTVRSYNEDPQGLFHKTPVLMTLGGSWVVRSEVISPLIWLIGIVTLLISPFIATHEPPSMAPQNRPGCSLLLLPGLLRRTAAFLAPSRCLHMVFRGSLPSISDD